MTKKSHWPLVGLLIVIAFTALGYGVWSQYNLHKHPSSNSNSLELLQGTFLNQPHPLQAFKLVDSQGHAFNNENLKTHWSFLFFGFSRCPMLCPTTLGTLKTFYANLLASHQQPMPQIIFITVDPEYDTPQRLKQYLLSFNSNFIGLSGEKAEVDQLAQNVNVLYMKIYSDQGAPDDYTIDHSGALLLINPQGQLTAVFSSPQDANTLTKDFKKILGFVDNRLDQDRTY